MNLDVYEDKCALWWILVIVAGRNPCTRENIGTEESAWTIKVLTLFYFTITKTSLKKH